MKKFLLGTVALVALGATVPALAADLPARTAAPYTKAPAYVAPIYNWTGFYIGGHIGGAFAGNNSLSGSDGRFLGGV
nr:porin family protein [Bradyrhizobium sp.]